MQDPSEMRSVPDGIRVARIVERGDEVRAVFSGKTRASISLPRTSFVRVCVHVGDDGATRVLRCTFAHAGRLLTCR